MEGIPATKLVPEFPLEISSPAPEIMLIDFGRVAFGKIRLQSPTPVDGEIRIHFGEKLHAGRIDRTPPGSVRYASATTTIQKAGEWQTVSPAADDRNTGPRAVPLPSEWGVILPFRWIEIEGCSHEDLASLQVQRLSGYLASWNDDASTFASSDKLLDQVWELCRYSIKATTFAGIYIDGDRERIPYEADAFLNQLSHYACDADPTMARATYDWLIKAPTWPTEWASHMIFMAHADWMHTGDIGWLAKRYEGLKSKLHPDREGSDGLIFSDEEQMKRDIVDWPQDERDDFQFTPVNAVVNAFQYRALLLMAELAQALDLPQEQIDLQSRAGTLKSAYEKTFLDPNRGIYRDGRGTEHASQHANIFALAFDLVPPEYLPTVVEYIKSRGMACSVYVAQYLLEGLFTSGEADYALQLMLAPGQRSWRHMVESGTTITWEAWDQCYKPNQDWNHAWGAAPANLLPRYVLGVQPLEPGYGKISVRPQLGSLSWARGVVPTLHGPIHVHATRELSGEITLDVRAPESIEVIRQPFSHPPF